MPFIWYSYKYQLIVDVWWYRVNTALYCYLLYGLFFSVLSRLSFDLSAEMVYKAQEKYGHKSVAKKKKKEKATTYKYFKGIILYSVI